MAWTESRVYVLIFLVILSTLGQTEGECPGGKIRHLNTWGEEIHAETGYKSTDVCTLEFKPPDKNELTHSMLSVNITKLSCETNLRISGIATDLCSRTDLPTLLVFMQCNKPCNETTNCRRITDYPVTMTYGEGAVDRGYNFSYWFETCTNTESGSGDYAIHNEEDGNGEDGNVAEPISLYVKSAAGPTTATSYGSHESSAVTKFPKAFPNPTGRGSNARYTNPAMGPKSTPAYLVGLLVPLGSILLVFFLVMGTILYRRFRRSYTLARLEAVELSESRRSNQEAAL